MHSARQLLRMCTAAAVFTAASTATAQCDRQWTWTGEPGDHLGTAVAAGRDFNFDDVPDIVATAPFSDMNGSDSGGVLVFSGQDTSIILAIHGSSSGEQLGSSVAVLDDLNHDETPEVLVGGLDHDIARLYSGTDGAVIYEWAGSPGGRFGWSVGDAGDTNSDGISDVVIGEPFAGRAHVFSGATGELVRVWGYGDSGDRFGSAVTGVGDLDRDGFDDVLIGASRGNSSNEPGQAFVLSGRNGSVLRKYTGTSDGDYLGYSVAVIGDVTNDGVNEFAIGAPGHEVDRNPLVGRVIVCSGIDGTIIHEFLGETSGTSLGDSLASAGDVNGDGWPDLIAGAADHYISGERRGRAYVFASLHGSTPELYLMDGESHGDNFGASVASAGDLNNDGFADVVIGGPYSDAGGIDTGRTYAWLGGCGQYGIAMTPLIAGQEAQIEIHGATPGATQYLLYSTRGLGWQFISSLGTAIYLRWPILIGSVQADKNGVAIFNEQVPHEAADLSIWLEAVEDGASTPVRMSVVAAP